MRNVEQIINDFKQQYVGCYVRLKGTNEVVLIQQVKTDGVVIFEHADERKTAKAPPWSGPKTIDYSLDYNLTLPETGVYIHKKRAIYLYRRVDRHWTKGPTNSTFKLSGVLQGVDIQISFELLKSVYDDLIQKRYSLTDGIQEAFKTDSPILVGNNISILTLHDDCKCICYKTSPIASFDKDHLIFYKNIPILTDNIKEAYGKLGYPTK